MPILSSLGAASRRGFSKYGIAVAGTTYATWNPSDKGGGVVLSNANLTASISTTPTDGGCVRSTIGKSSGKWYWEITANSTQYTTVAVMNGTDSVASGTFPGAGPGGYMYYGLSGTKYNNGASTSYGTSFGTTIVIGVKLDMTAGTIEFLRSNVSQGVAFTGLTGTMYAATGNYSISANLCTANFGATAFTYSVPSGYNAGLYT